MTEVYDLIAAETGEGATLSTTRACELLGVSTSSYYDSLKRQPSARQERHQALLEVIRDVHETSRGTYGSPRMHAALKAEGWDVGLEQVARVMAKNDVVGVHRRRGTRTTVADPSVARYPDNVLDRQFEVGTLDRVWVTDTTYLPTREGFLYLAAIVDLCSRKVVGYATSDRNDTNLCLAALDKAASSRNLTPGWVHHSDRGATYTSSAYQDRLAQLGATVSMSRRGNCWDNAVAESLFGTIKTEIGVEVWDTRRDAELDTFSFLEGWYNTRRLHSTLGYLSPDEFEAQHQAPTGVLSTV